MKKQEHSLYHKPSNLLEMLLSAEDRYVAKRLFKSYMQSIPFYLCRIFPIKNKKIVFTTIEGTCGYMCNPKYIAEEFIRRGLDKEYELVWLVNDTKKIFPKQIRVVKNSLWNRAYELSTAGRWIDNSRKQLEVRKRKGQKYIQTWHAKVGFKPTCLDRGKSFTKIAYLVSKHDSDMVDYWLSNSDWYDRTLLRGSLYKGKALRTGSPRCDVLVRAKEDKSYHNSCRQSIMRRYLNAKIENGKDIRFVMYAPTFRGGSQDTERDIAVETGGLDYSCTVEALENKFGGKWYVLLRLHPQLSARHMKSIDRDESLIDVSDVDDMYELLAGCDAFITDYSSAAFDAMVMNIPLFLYCNDYKRYEKERGSLLWDLRTLPFPLAGNNKELADQIENFNEEKYIRDIDKFMADTGMTEDGKASKSVVDFIIDK